MNCYQHPLLKKLKPHPTSFIGRNAERGSCALETAAARPLREGMTLACSQTELRPHLTHALPFRCPHKGPPSRSGFHNQAPTAGFSVYSPPEARPRGTASPPPVPLPDHTGVSGWPGVGVVGESHVKRSLTVHSLEIQSQRGSWLTRAPPASSPWVTDVSALLCVLQGQKDSTARDGGDTCHHPQQDSSETHQEQTEEQH